MKNLLLGFSLAANIALGYLIYQNKDQVADIKSRLDNLGEQAEGKAKQVKGALTGNAGDKIEGNLQEGKGRLQDTFDDMKDEVKGNKD